MTKEEKSEDVIYKTHTAIEKLPDGSCIKRVTVTRNGKSVVKEEKVECETALKDARGADGKDETEFKHDNDKFDKKMKEKLNEMNKSFSNQNGPTLSTKEETYTDGANKTVKVSRESSSIEETKKTEKIPDGTKRSLKITRESFLEETKKSVSPESLLPEEINERVKILDESFIDEAKDNSESEVTVKGESDKPGVNEDGKSTESLKDGKKSDSAVINESNEEEDEDDDPLLDDGPPNENMELVESEDNFFVKALKAAFKVLFYPLYALNIL